MEQKKGTFAELMGNNQSKSPRSARVVWLTVRNKPHLGEKGTKGQSQGKGGCGEVTFLGHRVDWGKETGEKA